MTILAHRYHDFSYGHRVVGHENKCSMMHGHNGRVTFYAEASKLDKVGRVVDFSVLKSTCCNWVEENWDHKFLVWEEDPILPALLQIEADLPRPHSGLGIAIVGFNPTAENMAQFLLDRCNYFFRDTPFQLVRVDMLETRKCGASVRI